MPDSLTRLMTQAETADYLGVPPRTLEDWRLNRQGPPFIKLGRTVRYKPADVDRWLAAHTVETTGD